MIRDREAQMARYRAAIDAGGLTVDQRQLRERGQAQGQVAGAVGG